METPNHCQLMHLCSQFVAAHGGVEAAARTLGLTPGHVHQALTFESPTYEPILIRIAEEIGNRSVIPERRFAVLKRDR